MASPSVEQQKIVSSPLADQHKIIIRPYRSATDSDLLLDHLKTVFRLDSPMFSGLGLTEQESEPLFRQLIEDADLADVSYIALDVDQAKTVGRWPIVGCVLASIEDKIDPDWKKASMPQLTTKKQRSLMQFVNEMYGGTTQELSMTRVLKLDIFSVAPAYRGQHLCKRMLQLCMQNAITRKACDVALVLATSHQSQALLAQEKFVTINLCYFDDYNKRQQDNECHFLMKDPKNTTAKLLMKILLDTTLWKY